MAAKADMVTRMDNATAMAMATVTVMGIAMVHPGLG